MADEPRARTTERKALHMSLATTMSCLLGAEHVEEGVEALGRPQETSAPLPYLRRRRHSSSPRTAAELDRPDNAFVMTRAGAQPNTSSDDVPAADTFNRRRIRLPSATLRRRGTFAVSS